MTDQDGRAAFDHDDELRALLAAGDPASSLPLADPAGVARLLEDTMNDEPDYAAAPPSRRRNPFVWVAAAAAAVLVVGLGAYAFTGDGDGADGNVVADPQTTPTSSPTVEAQGVLTLQAPAATGPLQSKCIVPTSATLASRDVAFQGTVEAITDGVVTIRPQTFFSGRPAAEVRVQKPLETTIGEGLTFKVGQSYLISAVDGVVGVCGLSGPASDGSVKKLYDDAFN